MPRISHEQFSEGLTVYAGTINPYFPRQLITSSNIPFWLESAEEQETAEPVDAQCRKK